MPICNDNSLDRRIPHPKGHLLTQKVLSMDITTMTYFTYNSVVNPNTTSFSYVHLGLKPYLDVNLQDLYF